MSPGWGLPDKTLPKSGFLTSMPYYLKLFTRRYHEHIPDALDRQN